MYKKSEKSDIEYAIEEAINHMGIMIQKSVVKIEDAEYLVEQAFRVLQKCEELRLSRDNWRNRCEEAEEHLRLLGAIENATP